MTIELCDYNPEWAKIFEAEKELIASNFPVREFFIEHIGSTSVPNLKAKPVIDILLGIPGLENDMPEIINYLNTLGYEYVEKYNAIMPDRRFFFKDTDGQRSHHIHTAVTNSPFWKRHLFFRNYLRNNPVAKEKYQQLKIDLAKREWDSGNDYADAKDDFIRGIEKMQSRG